MSQTRCRTLALAFFLLPLGCGSGPAGPVLRTAELRILFLGNSLTYTNGLPGLVETVAEAAGHDVETAMVARPNWSLEEHWRTGSADAIRELAPDVVVLQQGPSTLPASRAHLRQWADSLARVAREVGAEPALLMVWPPDDPRYSFDAVLASYRTAAEGVDGTLIPAGAAWLEAWEADDRFVLYGPDRFHPARLGSVVAALTVVRTLFGESLVGLPERMAPSRPGRPEILLTEEALELLLPAVDRAVEAHAFR